MGKEDKEGVGGKERLSLRSQWKKKKSLAIKCITGTLSLCKSLFCFHVILRLHHRVATAVSYRIINKSLA